MALQSVPTWSTTAATNATADPTVGMAEGMAPSAVNDGIRALMASVAKWRDDLYGITAGLSTGGTLTAYTVTTNATYPTAAVMAGAIFTITPHTTSGAAPTLAVDGLTARALNVSTGVAVPTGALISGTPYMVRYTHATTEFIVLNPSIRPVTSADIIGGTQLTAPANNDTLPIYDLSATANKRILLSDFFLVINDFTADASPDSAADYVVTYDASATASKKVLLSNLPGRLGRGYIDGCALVYNSGSLLDIGAGVCRDSTNTVDLTCPALTAKDLASTWVAGSSAGLRATGAIANQTYHIWAGRTAASATADYYAHSSATAATALAAWQAESGGSSYAYVRHIGSIVRSGGSILQFVQYFDGLVNWTSPVFETVSPTFDTTQRNYALTVPTGINGLMVDCTIDARIASGTPGVIAGHPSQTLLAPTATSTPSNPFDAPTTTGNIEHAWTRTWRTVNASAQIAVRANATSTAGYISTFGFRHPRGKDA